MENLPLLASVWFGVLLAISPCPLTSNLLAVSFLGVRGRDCRGALCLGLSYGLGRALAYIVLAFILSRGLMAAPSLSFFLQFRSDLFMGLPLLFVGLMLLGVFKVSFSGGGMERFAHGLAGHAGIFAPLVLGFFFALGFCPVSAALFFGSLLPLCLKTGSSLLLPLGFGVGTAFPVVVSSVALVFLARKGQERFFNGLSRGEGWLRKLSAWGFLAAGAFFLYRAFA